MAMAAKLEIISKQRMMPQPGLLISGGNSSSCRMMDIEPWPRENPIMMWKMMKTKPLADHITEKQSKSHPRVLKCLFRFY